MIAIFMDENGNRKNGNLSMHPSSLLREKIPNMVKRGFGERFKG